jgi:hypothetical protein
MIPVEMGDKNTGKLGTFDMATEKLVLGSFSTVE